MGRIFSIIAAISALMVLLAGGATFWFSAAGAKNTERAAIATVANGLAGSIAMQLATLQQSVDGLAQSADVVAALNSGNPELINATAAKLQSVIPNVLRLRLLMPTITEPDQSQLPHMGFGDLEMVRATLTGKPKPVIQGEGEHRHLAITSAVTDNQRVIGVVLVSVKPDLPQQILAKTKFDDGLIELKQDQLTLATLGKSASKDNDPESINVGNSRWQINFWPDVELSFGDIGLISAAIVIPALMACLAFFIGYRKLAAYLREDQSSVLKAAKEMMQGKNVGNYPVHLDEMLPIITSLAQFKRVIDQENSPLAPGGDENKDFDFFDESFDIDFLEETTPAAANSFSSAAPISAMEMAAPIPVQETAKEPDLQSVTPPAEPAAPAPLVENWGLDLDLETPSVVRTRAATPLSEPPLQAPVQKTPAVMATNTLDADIFRDTGILGIAGKNLTEEIIANIGRAFASEARQQNIKSIVVSRDSRISSPALADALIKGLISGGCDVLDIGLVPTPVLYFVSHHTEGRTGIMVTGSYYPADYNGLKMVLHGEPLTAVQLQALKTRIANGDYNHGETGSVEQNTLFSNEYIGTISEDIHIVRPMTVVVDCANGATSQMGPMLLKSIGCDVVELNCEFDGKFPNHLPDPGKSETLEALIKAVKLNNADVGIAFDGDGERLGIVDSSGKIIWPDRQMMLFARDVLASKLGSEIIYDVACSKHLPEQITKRGGRPVMDKCDPVLMRALLKETGAALAGTMSGHFFFNDRWFGFDDAMYSAVRMIEILSADMRSSSELFDDLPNSINTPELYIPMAEGENVRFVEQMFGLANFGDSNIVNIDGMRAEFHDGWGLVRASGITPALIVRFEADSREAMNRIQAQFKYLMLQIKPDISLPF